MQGCPGQDKVDTNKSVRNLTEFDLPSLRDHSLDLLFCPQRAHFFNQAHSPYECSRYSMGVDEDELQVEPAAPAEEVVESITTEGASASAMEEID